MQAAGDVWRVCDQEICLEVQIRYGFEVFLQHPSITLHAELLAVVLNISADKTAQRWPVLGIQASEIVLIDTKKFLFGHALIAR